MYGTICANSVSTSITNSAKHALRPVISGAFHMFGTMKAEVEQVTAYFRNSSVEMSLATGAV